jgi:hypothetical protein
MNNMLSIEKKLMEAGDYIQTGTSAYAHQSFFRTSPESLQLGRMAMIGVEASKTLAKE